MPGNSSASWARTGQARPTTLEIVEGLRRPDAGTVSLLGRPAWPRDPVLLPRTGVQRQASSFFERLTAREQLRTFAALYRVPPAVPTPCSVVAALARCGALAGLEVKGGTLEDVFLQLTVLEAGRASLLDEARAASPRQLASVMTIRRAASLPAALQVVRVTAAWWMAVPVVICGTLAFMSIGLLFGALARTQQAATSIANLIILPVAFLGGAFVPLDFAPSWMRTVSSVLPLRYLVTGVQDVMARGLPAASALPAIAVLLGFTVVLTAAAGRFFRWDEV